MTVLGGTSIVPVVINLWKPLVSDKVEEIINLEDMQFTQLGCTVTLACTCEKDNSGKLPPDEDALSVAATFALMMAEDIKLAGMLFWDARDWTTPEEWAFIDCRSADCNWIYK